MTDQNITDLLAAGFVESSTGYFERNGVVVRYSAVPAPNFHVFGVDVKSHPSMDTAFIGEALAFASMVDGMEDLTCAILGDAMSSVAFHMGNLTGVKLDFGPAVFDPQTSAEMQAMAQRLAVFIAHAAKRADYLPRLAHHKEA